MEADDDQSKGVPRPKVYRFAKKDGADEESYVRDDCALHLVVERPRIKFALLGKTEVESIRVNRHQSVYDLAKSEGLEPPAEYSVAHLHTAPNLEILCDAKTGRKRFGLIDSSGVRSYDGAVSISIGIGNRSESHIRHYSNSSSPTLDEHVYISLWLTAGEIEALTRLSKMTISIGSFSTLSWPTRFQLSSMDSCAKSMAGFIVWLARFGGSSCLENS